MSGSLSGISSLDNKKLDSRNFNLVIHFKATVNGEPFVTRKNYTNPFNESFSVEKFKFYFGKARLIDESSGAEISFNPDEYFLVDFTDSVSCSVRLSLKNGKYRNIIFLLGVDSIHNVSGAQAGALDPVDV